MFHIAPQPELPAVLVIDDDLVSREVIATLLTMEGYTVHTADSGEAARSMLNAGQCSPDVIITDAQMKQLSGAELVSALRGVSNGAAIYVISGSQPGSATIDAADGFLLKPFAIDALKDLLNGKVPSPADSIPVSSEQAVSVAVLAQLRAMMSERAVREIFAAMVVDLDERLEALAAAIGRRDGQEIRRIGHAIKGGCGMAGATHAARLGALLESGTDGEDNHLDNSRMLLRDLRRAALELHRILDAEFPA